MVEPRPAPRQADPRACAYSATPWIFAPKGQHNHLGKSAELWIQLGHIIKSDLGLRELPRTTALPSKMSVSAGSWQEAWDPNRFFSKAFFWLESVLFKAVNLGIIGLHINRVPGKVVTRQLSHCWVSGCYSYLYAGGRAQVSPLEWWLTPLGRRSGRGNWLWALPLVYSWFSSPLGPGWPTGRHTEKWEF